MAPDDYDYYLEEDNEEREVEERSDEVEEEDDSLVRFWGKKIPDVVDSGSKGFPQIQDKDWLDEHLIIDGLDKDTANKIKDKIRERLTDERLPTTESNEKRKV